MSRNIQHWLKSFHFYLLQWQIEDSSYRETPESFPAISKHVEYNCGNEKLHHKRSDVRCLHMFNREK